MRDEDLNPVAQDVIRDLAARGLTVAVAESCTGGLVAHLLTNVPGSSDVFLLGVVAYANAFKEKLLGVESGALRDFGAVSVQVARQMACGIQAASGADLAVATSGIAGPGGAQPGKPVGTVCFGFASPQGSVGKRLLFDGSRQEIKLQAAEYAIDWLRRYREHEVG